MRIGLNSLARATGVGFVAPGEDSLDAAAAPPRSAQKGIAALTRPRWGVLEHNLAAEQDRWFPWTVAAFAGGIGVYFALADEPSRATAIVAALVGVFLFGLGARSSATMLRFACAALAASSFGFAAAKLRTETVAAPAILRDTRPLMIEGRIETVFVEDATHARMVLVPSSIGRSRDSLPARVRLSLRGAKAVAAVAPGRRVSTLAVLRPPPEPAQPGGYDFARWAFFSGIGGVGYTLGAPKPLDGAAETSLWVRATTAVERLRLSMAARIQSAVPGPDGAISAALITGERAAISDEDNAAYRDSGLFHVLSISGVHMALAGLGIFWIIRAVLALFPSIALTRPIKKWAAAGALVAASFYLLISGAGAPAIRSFIMLGVMLLGVLADRPLLSMRSVALSALLILAFRPEGVIDPSFQMSFAAIVGLIGIAEWYGGRKRDDIRPTAFVRVLRWGRRYVGGLILASIVAGFATAPFAIYHFDRAPGYSLLANFLADPVVGLVIMPAACLTVAAMPFHLEHGPAQLMGWGVGRLTDIAHWVASLPGAVNLLPAWPATALIVISVGGLWLGLWRRRWRWIGLAPIAAGLALAFSGTPPDILVARDAGAMAVRKADGRFTILGKIDDYTAGQWLLRDGDAREVYAARAGAVCDEWGCIATARNGEKIALALKPGALVDDCRRAAVLVSVIPLRQSCAEPKQVFDRFDAVRGGATALWLAGDGVRALSVAQIRGHRPWTRSGASQ